MASSAPSTSQHRLFEDPPHRKGISIQDWTITTTKTPISNAVESEEAAASLHLPLPEICFGNNKLEVENKSKGIKFEWGTIEALKEVEKESGLKVAHAEEWAAGQRRSGSSQVEVQKPFDWTYTTLYTGTLSPSNATFEPAPSSHPGIPLHLLARQDIPIHFFDEIPLFEDELGDNGTADLVVRVRVNAFSIFILSRFFLRIDHVLFRIFDVRLYVDLENGEVVRETKGRQGNYDDVKARLPLDRPNDLTPLTDVNWVSSTLEQLAQSPPKRNKSTKKVQWPPSPLTAQVGRMGSQTNSFGSVASVGSAGSGTSMESLEKKTDEMKIGSGKEEEVKEEEEEVKWKAEGRKLEIMKF